MARKAKVVPVVVESTEVVSEAIVEQEVVEQDDTTIEQPSLLASMLQQEVKPLEEIKETEVPVAKVEKNIGVGQLVRKLIAEGLTNTVILKIVHEQYGNKNTTYACIAWYRNKVKKNTALTTKAVAVETVEKFLEPEAEDTEQE